MINEVLTHTDPPQVDSIELYNTTGANINIGGWYLSESWGLTTNPDTGDDQKVRIPGHTWSLAGAYLRVGEEQHRVAATTQLDALMLSRQEAAAKQAVTGARVLPGHEHAKARQVVVLTAEPVAQP